MIREQTVWMSPRATSFTAVCDRCLEDHDLLAATVRGNMHLERNHTTVTCDRGHDVEVRRAARSLAGVIR